MSGEASPAAATKILEAWRGTLGEEAEQALADMALAQNDQSGFTRAARKLLAALNLAEAEVESEPDDQTDEGEDGSEQAGSQDNAEQSEGDQQSDAESMLGAQPEQMEGDSSDDQAMTMPRKMLPQPTARTAPAAHSSAARSRYPTTNRPIAPIPASPTKKSRPRTCATPRN